MKNSALLRHHRSACTTEPSPAPPRGRADGSTGSTSPEVGRLRKRHGRQPAAQARVVGPWLPTWQRQGSVAQCLLAQQANQAGHETRLASRVERQARHGTLPPGLALPAPCRTTPSTSSASSDPTGDVSGVPRLPRAAVAPPLAARGVAHRRGTCGCHRGRRYHHIDLETPAIHFST